MTELERDKGAKKEATALRTSAGTEMATCHIVRAGSFRAVVFGLVLETTLT